MSTNQSAPSELPGKMTYPHQTKSQLTGEIGQIVTQKTNEANDNHTHVH